MSASLLASILTERGIVSVQATDTASDGTLRTGASNRYSPTRHTNVLFRTETLYHSLFVERQVCQVGEKLWQRHSHRR